MAAAPTQWRQMAAHSPPGLCAYTVEPSHSPCLIDPGPAAANAPWTLRFDRYEIVTGANGSIPVLPSKPNLGHFSLMLLAVLRCHALQTRRCSNSLHKPIECLAKHGSGIRARNFGSRGSRSRFSIAPSARRKSGPTWDNCGRCYAAAVSTNSGSTSWNSSSD
jgi:hypothetical protein